MVLGFKTKPVVGVGDEPIRLDLRQWLGLSWFFDEGFEKQHVVEDSESLRVIGKNQIYKFIKPAVFNDSKDALGFFESWMEAVQEIQDHRFLCKDLYQGVRMIGVRDDEPYWLNAHPQMEIDSEYPPSGVHSVAVVSRRIETEKSLAAIYARSADDFEDYLERATKFLSSFHRFQIKNALHISSSAWFDEFREHSEQLCSNVLSSCRNSSASHRVIRQVQKHFNQLFNENASLLFDRIEEGFVTDIHGDVKSRNIIFEYSEYIPRRPGIINRVKRDSHRRISDVLYDLASLMVDFASCGDLRSAKRAETIYQENSLYYEPEVLRFYILLVCLERMQENLEYKARWKDLEGFIKTCSVYLGEKSPPSIILVVGAKSAFKAEFLRSLCLMQGCEIIRHRQENFCHLGVASTAEFKRCRSYLRRGNSIVVTSEKSAIDVDFDLRQLAKDRHLPFVSLKIDKQSVEIRSSRFPSEENSRSNLDSTSSFSASNQPSGIDAAESIIKHISTHS